MKKAVPYIIFAAVLIAVAAIVIKGISDDNTEKRERAEYAAKIMETTDFSKEYTEENSYEYFQQNPENGMYVIYEFAVFKNNDDLLAGTIKISGDNVNTAVACAVQKSGADETFLFGGYIGDSDKIHEVNVGDVLVRLHHKEENVVPEFVGLDKAYAKEDIVPNF